MKDRPDYIRKIAPFIDVPIVKILAGIRRSGKSTILVLLKEELLRRGVTGDRIIERRYTSMVYAGLETNLQMYQDIRKAIEGKGHCYLLLDELQEIEGWEKSVNSLLEECDVDIYITGSNSRLMPSEISTYLTGRYVSIPVYTLSFAEYLAFKKESGLDRDRLLEGYIRMGGFPLIADGTYDEDTASQIVGGIYHTIVSRDIALRHSIGNVEMFERVVMFVVENVGKTFSANSIYMFFKSQHRSVGIETVYNYLKWLADAFLIYPCRRYDLMGKEVLKTQEKYYLGDVSLKYALFGYTRNMRSEVLENIVFLELSRRGWQVYVGKLGTNEIDFVCIKGSDRIYVQVCDQMPSGSSREIENLKAVKDNYPKYVVTMDRLACGNEEGIQVVALADFLLG